jgi:hypothetical protein
MSWTTILLIIGAVAIMLLMHRVGRGGHGEARAHASGEPSTEDYPRRRRRDTSQAALGTAEHCEHAGHASHERAGRGAPDPRRRHGCC